MATHSEKPNKQKTAVPPVVAVLGHVDHGKTTLLDTIRKTSIAQKEHGGITQKIGASRIEIEHEGAKRSITFIDTPGHEAFLKMRSRGAQAADIGLLVVAANDGVKPQTKESISILVEARIPIIVVMTKVDLPVANVEKTKQQLLKEGILLEGLGGSVPYIGVSAKTGENIKELLELILLVFDLHLPKEIGRQFHAVAIESKLDPKVGPRATIVVKDGFLRAREEITVDGVVSRVRALIDDRGNHLKEAGVGDAVEVLGFTKVPNVGSVILKKQEAGNMPHVQEKDTAGGENKMKEAVSPFVFSEDSNVLSVILCADTLGSLEAIVAALPESIRIVEKKTGEISEADILMAKSVNAIVIGFNIKIRSEVLRLAATEKVLLKNYTVIYELLDEITDVVEGKKAALEEKILGRAKVLALFPFDKEVVLGIKVIEGRVARGDKVHIVRGKDTIGEGTIKSVRQGKESRSKIGQGEEAGIIVSVSLDFTIGDMVICHG